VALSAKQLRFVAEYLVDHNATQAAVRAGYSEGTAKSQGSRLLTNADIKAEVEKRETKVLGQLEFTALRVKEERARLALYDIGDYADVKSPEDVKKLPIEQRQAIVGWTYNKDGNLVPKLANKHQHLTAAEKMLGLYKDGGIDSGVHEIHIHMRRR